MQVTMRIGRSVTDRFLVCRASPSTSPTHVCPLRSRPRWICTWIANLQPDHCTPCWTENGPLICRTTGRMQLVTGFRVCDNHTIYNLFRHSHTSHTKFRFCACNSNKIWICYAILTPAIPRLLTTICSRRRACADAEMLRRWRPLHRYDRLHGYEQYDDAAVMEVISML